jgi:hypothetical protein
MSIVSNVAYCAVQMHDEAKTVFALIIKLSKDRGDWNYRDDDESMGPYHYDCPARILDLLTPTTDEYANNWRQQCRERLQLKRAKPKPGNVIRFATPVRFGDGVTESVFTCETMQRRGRNNTVFRRKGDGMLCRITGLSRMNYTVEAAS